MISAAVGIDPGKAGAMALVSEDGCAVAVDWSTEKEMLSTLRFWSSLWDIKVAVLEQVHVQPRDGRRAATTFMKHAGAWECLLELSDLPWATVTPQKWQKRRIRAKAHKNDKPSLGYVSKKYPMVILTGPKGGQRDGRSDAVCIAEYALENWKEITR